MLVSSEEIVESMDDILLQIMLLLPVKSLMRFKSVSRRWKCLITSPHFSLMRNPSPNPAVGLFYPAPQSSQFHYISLDGSTDPPFTKLSFADDPLGYWIHQSCNGLLLCCSSGCSGSGRTHRSPIRVCYVYNPTTNCFTKLPRPGVLNGVPRIVHGVNLVFNQDKSPPYEVVCVRGSELAIDLVQIEIYSPDSGVWRVSGKPFKASASIFGYGVYWNGSVHWICYPLRLLLFFNVDQEMLRNVPLPREMNDHNRGRRRVVLGESCGHLHMIERCDTEWKFSVHEMKKDYSQWFVKYQLDLTMVTSTSPQMTFRDFVMSRVLVFSLIRDDEGKGPFLVFSVGSKCIRFNLEYNTFVEICAIGNDVGNWFPFAFEHIESLVCVN